MKHFINIKDIPAIDLKKIILDAKKRKQKRKNFNLTLYKRFKQIQLPLEYKKKKHILF